jgi:1-acyl-sn-glycerol-3-phosphate acyltransferase
VSGWWPVLKRGPEDTRLYWVIWHAISLPLRVAFRLKVDGIEHLPTTGRVVVACNHISNLDPIFLGVAADRQMHFMAKSTLWKFAPLGRLIDGLGSFPVRRGEADRDAIRAAISYLDAGAVVAIFPEGTRQQEGRLGEPMPGFALLALRKDVVTIPAVLTGTNRIGGGLIPRLSKVTVSFGPPLDVDAAGLSKGERHHEIGRRLVAEWADLLSRQSDPRPGDR